LDSNGDCQDQGLFRSRAEHPLCDDFAYIEGYYNRARIHSAIGYITPQQAEAKAA
jgi:transposase InsO family protein